jgi:hypothetical protein
MVGAFETNGELPITRSLGQHDTAAQKRQNVKRPASLQHVELPFQSGGVDSARKRLAFLGN